MFDPKKTTEECVAWIRDFFAENGRGCNAVVGISGGKDSSVVAALCVKALGKDRVIGVLMPCGEQSDIDMAKLLVKHLGIRHYIINIRDAVEGLKKNLPFELSVQTVTNIPPRVRMTTLYAVAQSHNGRVANTCNLSEAPLNFSLSVFWPRVTGMASTFSQKSAYTFSIVSVKAFASSAVA